MKIEISHQLQLNKPKTFFKKLLQKYSITKKKSIIKYLMDLHVNVRSRERGTFWEP